MDIPTTDRRTVLKSSAAILGVAGTGLGAIALTSEDAQAAISVASFDALDTSRTLAPDQIVRDVIATVTLAYEYQSSHEIDEARFAVEVANGSGEFHPLTEKSVGGPPKEDSGTHTLSGSLIDSGAFNAGNFDVATGSTIAIDVGLRVTMTLWRNGEQVALADKSDTQRVVLGKEALTVSGSVGGEAVTNVTVGTETPSG